MEGLTIMKTNIGQNILKCFLTLLVGAFLGTVLLVLAFLIPVDEEKAWESLDIIVAEDSYPALPIVGDFSGMNLLEFKPGVLDNNTDKIMLFTALDIGDVERGSALTRSMRMYNGYLRHDYAY